VIWFLGNKVGNFFGNAKDGLIIEGDTFSWKGWIKVYLKNGNELRLSFRIKPTISAFSRKIRECSDQT
jgi:hypothetical protein